MRALLFVSNLVLLGVSAIINAGVCWWQITGLLRDP